ncbi:MAG: tRNA (N6-isopentenyl adenosine(37)-C2)-methylthiotransferase MiaB [Desulfovibrionaceae bacterium]|nr:tRNA (N6-isopentenyl adenosine(37)-C2)-methylthiotransferase MiaB [Desulfovibrionaceae bacterium]
MNFHIITFGCQMNVADSEWLAGMLEGRGMTRVGTAAEADVVLLNTCSVREKPELKVRSALGRVLQETGGRRSVLVGVAGCVAQQLGETLYSYSPQVRLVAGTDQTASIPDAVELLAGSPGRTLCLTGFTKTYHERPQAKGAQSPTAFVNIMQGCDNFCTYCIVPFTRGRQKSRAASAVVDECRSVLEAGAREITLLGQNVNAYGKDKTGDGTSFAELLRRVCALDPTARIRYVTPHPKDMTAEDVAAFAELPNLCPRLHLPMQAGADRVLKRMNRRYDHERFAALVDDLRRARPDLALSTDLIVGFPGETEEEFQETLAMVRRCGFMSSFSFCYSDRPGTRASTFLDKIAAPVQLDRLQRLQALQDELTGEWLAGRVGQRTEVLVEQQSPKQGGGAGVSWQGRDPYGALVHVALAEGENPVGQVVPVTITSAFRHSLHAERLV